MAKIINLILKLEIKNAKGVNTLANAVKVTLGPKGEM